MATGGAEVAVLEERFLAATRRWPMLSAHIDERLAEQVELAAQRAAILGLPRVEDRVLALFWQLADRWGVVRPEGVVVRLADACADRAPDGSAAPDRVPGPARARPRRTPAPDGRGRLAPRSRSSRRARGGARPVRERPRGAARDAGHRAGRLGPTAESEQASSWRRRAGIRDRSRRGRGTGGDVITTGTLLQPGGEFAGAAAVRRLRAGTELAVEVGRDETVSGLAVALEILDTGRPPNDLEAIVAGSACHVPVGPGDIVVAEIDGLGTVAAMIAP